MLVFYGNHSSDWMTALNHENLAQYLFPKINSIKNILSFNASLYSAEYIIPLMEAHIIDLHNRNVSAIMPGLDAVKTFMCKKKFADFVIDNGLTGYVPKMFFSPDETKNKIIIVKPYNLNSGRGQYITDKKLEQKVFDNFVVQEYIFDDKEYVSHVVSQDGNIKCCITYEYKFNTDRYIKGASTKSHRKLDLDASHLEIIKLFLGKFKYTGVCNFGFKIINGEMKLFEINPRMGGSLMQKHNINDLVEIINTLIWIGDHPMSDSEKK
jgi:carbamoylphosphate synthase large subunit